jgi:hypothetical protein
LPAATLAGPAVKSARRATRIGDTLADRAVHQKCVGGSRLAERTLISGGRLNLRLGFCFRLLGQTRLSGLPCLRSLSGAALTSIGIPI